MKTTNRVSLLCALILSAFTSVGADSPPNDAFIKAVSALSAEQQIGAVVAKLKELNPNFDGKETHKIENGAVTTLSFSTVGVTDISPVKALQWLRTLNIVPPTLNQKGLLADLSPLNGLQLTWLWCHNNPITDLSPLKGLPLTVLSFGGTRVGDLSPLAGMKLQVLSLNDTVVSDIAPLEEMPLTVLWCNNTKVTDLTPLKAMSLREIKCDFVAERDASILRGIKALAKINDLPATTFWMRNPGSAGILPASGRAATAQQPAGKMPALSGQSTTPPPSGLSAKKQIEQFVAKMKELNPDFDGQVEPIADGQKVIELKFSASGVKDISPIRMFTKLQNLICDAASSTKRSELSDLSALQGIPLTYLSCSFTAVNDLTPLKSAPLTRLYIHVTKVSDLSPLKGKRLQQLHIAGLPISDLSPLKGMPLMLLRCENTAVSDLSILKGMPLKELRCDFVADRDTKILRSIKTLETINNLPAKEFWKRVEAGNVPAAK